MAINSKIEISGFMPLSIDWGGISTHLVTPDTDGMTQLTDNFIATQFNEELTRHTGASIKEVASARLYSLSETYRALGVKLPPEMAEQIRQSEEDPEGGVPALFSLEGVREYCVDFQQEGWAERQELIKTFILGVLSAVESRGEVLEEGEFIREVPFALSNEVREVQREKEHMTYLTVTNVGVHTPEIDLTPLIKRLKNIANDENSDSELLDETQEEQPPKMTHDLLLVPPGQKKAFYGEIVPSYYNYGVPSTRQPITLLTQRELSGIEECDLSSIFSLKLKQRIRVLLEKFFEDRVTTSIALTAFEAEGEEPVTLHFIKTSPSNLE